MPKELTNAEILEALKEKGAPLPDNLEELKRPALVKLAKDNDVDIQKIENNEITTKLDEAGFKDKEEMEHFLNACKREKNEHAARLKTLETKESELKALEVKLLQREASVKEAANHIQEKLQEAKKQTEYWVGIKQKVDEYQKINSPFPS